MAGELPARQLVFLLYPHLKTRSELNCGKESCAANKTYRKKMRFNQVIRSLLVSHGIGRYKESMNGKRRLTRPQDIYSNG